MRNTVGLVGETGREARVELMECRVLQDLRVDFGYAVNAVAAQDGQVGHVDLSIPEDGNIAGHVFVARVAFADLFEPAPVDFIDDEVNARQELFEHGNRPFFHGFRQDRMVRIGYGTDRYLPRVFPVHTFFVHEDPHQFGDDQGRMGIVNVQGNVMIEIIHAFFDFLLIVADDRLQACGNHEVFLHEPQFAPFFCAVLRIEETGNELDAVLIAEGAVPVAHRKFPVHVFPRVFSPPQA